MAASKLGWEVVGIRDGFDGLLFPDRYPEGGTMPLTHNVIGDLSTARVSSWVRPRAPIPFTYVPSTPRTRSRSWTARGVVANDSGSAIEAVISVVSGRALSILFKLHRKGLKTICVPKSVENDIAATQLSFGFNSALSFATEILDRARQAAESARKIAVVEVLGELTLAGWLAGWHRSLCGCCPHP